MVHGVRVFASIRYAKGPGGRPLVLQAAFPGVPGSALALKETRDDDESEAWPKLSAPCQVSGIWGMRKSVTRGTRE